MGKLSLFFILYWIFRSPVLSLIVVFLVYLIIDRLFFHTFRDVLQPIKRFFRISSLKKSLELNPSDATQLSEIGILYFQSRNYPLSIENLKSAYAKMSDSAELHLYLGMAEIENKNYEAGKEELLKAISINRSAGYGMPYIYLLKYEILKGNAGGPEIEKLEKELESFGNSENHCRMGLFYKKQRYLSRAKEMFSAAIKDYRYCPKNLKKLHRKWAWLARFNWIILIGQK